MKKSILATMAAIGLMAGAPAFAQAPTELTVIVYGGSFEQGWKRSVIEPFEAANPDVKIRIATGLTQQAIALMRAQKNDVKVDVMMMDEVGAAQAHTEGLYEPLAPARVPNIQKLYPQFRVAGDPYTKFMYVAQALVWNKDRVKGQPDSWRALWQPEHKGRVVLPDISTSHGSMFLLTAAEMAGGGATKIDPGFDLIKTLKPNVLTYYTQHAQMAQLFTQGDASITSWTSDRAQAAIDGGAPLAWVVPKEGGYIIDSTIGIAKGTKKLDAALRYVNFVLSEAAQAANAEHTYLGPVNKEVKLRPEIASRLPVKDLPRLKTADWTYVTKVRPDWAQRWMREIAAR
jgi:putative spermidine/putrescine transport system substrate-binding protein